MDKIEMLPWYDDYLLILEECRLAEKAIEDFENPEKQLQRVKKFYNNIGADYLKNNWLLQEEENIMLSNGDEDGRLGQLKREVRVGKAIENALLKQDDESLSELGIFKDDEIYKQLIRQIMFYIGVSRVKTEITFIERACTGITKKYPLSKTALFLDEGAAYYIYYLECLQECIKNYKNEPEFGEIKRIANDRCMNLELMMNNYRDDLYVGEAVRNILSILNDVRNLINALTEEG